MRRALYWRLGSVRAYERGSRPCTRHVLLLFVRQPSGCSAVHQSDDLFTELLSLDIVDLPRAAQA